VVGDLGFFEAKVQEFEGFCWAKRGAAGVQMDQTTCQRAFADGFHNEPAGNIMAFSDHTQMIVCQYS